jgi:hypothetical protein
LYNIAQILEGNRIVDFGWGTASAKQVVVRFGFKGPAGTYHAKFNNLPSGAVSIVQPFTIAAGQANTDTQQVLVFPGATTGTFLTDSSASVGFGVTLAAGSSLIAPASGSWQSGNYIAAAGQLNGLASTSNVFELFDVGLYLDPNNTGVPPPWVTPDYASELLACQRYWVQCSGIFSGSVTSAINYYTYGRTPVPPRTTPSWAMLDVGVVSGFPATAASLLSFNTIDTVRENRTANATNAGALWQSKYTANARM